MAAHEAVEDDLANKNEDDGRVGVSPGTKEWDAVIRRPVHCEISAIGETDAVPSVFLI